jgi:hypothetical protein
MVMKASKLLFIITLGAFLFLNTGCGKKTVSIESLLNEMVDRNELARFPDPAFTCKQFSSYDRASVAKDLPGWFANDDCSMFIRVEDMNGRREFVLMDTEGPGAIVRWWMTFGGKNSGKGIMRVYIDDFSTPAIEGAAFDVLSGNLICSPPLAASVSELSPYENRGHNLYFPIPYSQRCKVTYESETLYDAHPGKRERPTEAAYYNINDRTYEQGAKVISWSASEMEKNQTLIAKVQKQLADKDRGVVEKGYGLMNAILQPGESRSFPISGSHAIQKLSMEIKAENQDQALRSTVLEIAFDGERTVWSPVGDFYGIGYKPLYTSTWFTQVEKDGLMSSFWVMPFKKECVITLHNMGEQDVTIPKFLADYSKWKWDNRSMYFGAGWQQYTGVVAGSHDAALDMNFVTLQGKGVYVGDALAIFNTTKHWWGEGDEKIYVDGETFPSHFGTGSEDYYGYAWCRPEVFTGHPYIAQPQGIGNFNFALSVNSRYRGLDAIPFNKSIQVDMELWPWGKSKFNYAPVAFWYALPGVSIDPAPRPDDARLPVAQKREDVIPPVYYEKGRIEGEGMNANSAKNNVKTQALNNVGWSGNSQVFWTNGAVGEELTLTFLMKEGGKFNVKAAFAVSFDYGIFSVFLNDKQAISSFDSYNPKVSAKVVDLGTFDLKEGENVIKVKAIGKNPKSPGYYFGLDYIDLTI